MSAVHGSSRNDFNGAMVYAASRPTRSEGRFNSASAKFFHADIQQSIITVINGSTPFFGVNPVEKMSAVLFPVAVTDTGRDLPLGTKRRIKQDILDGSLSGRLRMQKGWRGNVARMQEPSRGERASRIFSWTHHTAVSMRDCRSRHASANLAGSAIFIRPSSSVVVAPA